MKISIDPEELQRKLQSSSDLYLILKQSPHQKVEINQQVKVRDSNGQKRIGKVIAVDYPNVDHFVIEISNLEIPINMENDMPQESKLIEEILTILGNMSLYKDKEKFRLAVEKYGLYLESNSIENILISFHNFIKACNGKLNEAPKNGQEKK